MKAASKALTFEETPVKQAVRASVAVKEIERTIDMFGFNRIVWYMVKRYKFQISVLINVAFFADPIIRFGQQFFN